MEGERLDRCRRYYEVTQRVLNPHGGRTAKLCITPFIYDRTFRDRMDAITRAYANLLEFVFRSFPTSSSIQEVLDYPGPLENYIRSLNVYPVNMAAARIDVFLTRDGIRMVESNAEIPGGSEESYLLESEYLNIFRPEGVERIERLQIVLDMLLNHYRVQAEAKSFPMRDDPSIFLIQWQSEIDRIQGEYSILIDYIEKNGYRAGVIDPHELIMDGRAVKTPDGERIDIIYRRFTGDELPTFSRTSWQMAIDLDQADVAVVNPFCTKRVDSKNIMVLFRDPQYDSIFPEELENDLATVREIIPWTKKVEPEMEVGGSPVEGKDYLVENRERLVIKHANSYSSVAVFPGIDCEEKRWSEIVDEALEGDWIVQELIDLPEIDIEYWEDGRIMKERCIYNVNPYLYDGKLGGFYVRASTDRLTSFKVGEVATVLPCFMRKD